MDAACRFTLNRDAYRNSVVESIKRQRAAREEFIAQVKTFAKLRPNQRAKIADALQKVSFAAGEQIINQGDDGDLFYIIEKGDVIITVRLFIRRLLISSSSPSASLCLSRACLGKFILFSER